MKPRPPMRAVWSGIGHYVGFSRWIWASSVINLLLNQFDKVVVGKLLGPAQLGGYQMSSRLAQMLLADAAIAMSQYLFPTFAAHHRRSPEAASRIIKIYLLVIAIGLAAFVAVLRLIAEPLFSLILGAAWLPAVPLFRILVINMAIGALIAVLVAYLRAVGDAKATVHASAIQVVVLLLSAPARGALVGRDGHCLVHDARPWLRRGVDAVQDVDGKDSMMRVFHLVLAPRLSGAEVLAKDLAIDQSAEGMAVCVASLLPAHADFAALAGRPAEPRRAVLVSRAAQVRAGKLWNLFCAVRRFHPDVIFAHATIPSFYARALPLRVPVVYVMHSATNDFERPLFRRVEHVLSGRARMVIGVSEQGVTDYVQAIGPHPSMTVVPNGVDLARFAFTDGAGARRPGTPQVVQIGRYASVKNQLLTVRAFGEVLEQVTDARLVLYGVVEDPEYQRTVIGLAQELGIAHRVVVAGPRTDVASVLSESNVFVMPSRSEAHSVAFLEALASGIPIVASRIPSFAFANGFPGVQLVDTDDVPCYADAVVAALGQARAQRSLAGLTLRDTAARYRAIAHQVSSHLAVPAR